MRRLGSYADSGVNPIVAGQLNHMTAQRMQLNSGMNHYPGREELLRADKERQYVPSKGEGQWQWDRDGSKAPSSLPSHVYNEGQGSDASRALYQSQRSDSKLVLDKQTNQDTRTQALQEDMEVGYEDNNIPETFEGLEQKILQDFLKLTKEQQDAEDAENARHRERLSEINAQYQEKLVALRAHQATQRDEFLQKESQARFQQYQQVHVGSYQHNPGPSETHSLASAAGAPSALGDLHRAFSAGHFDSYGRRSEYLRSAGGNGGHGYPSRGPYPGGRAYNSGGRHF